MPTLEVSNETYEKIKDQLGEETLLEVDSLDDLVGKKLFIRTVTYHMLGKVEKRMGGFLHLKKASWIADSGRFMQFIKDGTPDEVEPVGECFVSINAIVDIFPWNHKLPTKQK